MTKLCGIYCITHIESGRRYVGQSINIKARLGYHSRSNVNTRISNAIQKHGWAAFKAEIVELCDKTMINDAEAKWIAFYNCISPNGYNLTNGGELREPNSEIRLKMSAAKLGHSMPDKTRIAIAKSRTGVKHSDVSKAQTSAKLVGRKFSEETRVRMSESAKKRYASGYGATLLAKATEANTKNRLLRQRIAAASA